MGTPDQTLWYRRRTLGLLLCAALLSSLSGCRFFVAAGKMMWGDPKNTSLFESTSGTNLEESEERLLIICSAPYSMLQELPSLQLDLQNRMARTLESHDLQIVSPDDVSNWFDEHGEWGDYSELAEHFDASYVIHLKLRTFSYLEPSSTQLLRGNSEGNIKVFRVDSGSDLQVQEVFDRNIQVRFPETYPVPRQGQSDQKFIDSLVRRIALQASQMFYDHHLRDTIH